MHKQQKQQNQQQALRGTDTKQKLVLPAVATACCFSACCLREMIRIGMPMAKKEYENGACEIGRVISFSQLFAMRLIIFAMFEVTCTRACIRGYLYILERNIIESSSDVQGRSGRRIYPFGPRGIDLCIIIYIVQVF
jgi:hypothetical protein